MSTHEATAPPWSPEVVEQLNRYQRGGYFHPFTCPREHGLSADLLATPAGWVCQEQGCDYTQDWYHEFMASKEIMDGRDEAMNMFRLPNR